MDGHGILIQSARGLAHSKTLARGEYEWDIYTFLVGAVYESF